MKLDRKEAVKWFTPAAKKGNADAQYQLGEAYHNGDGVKQNRREGKKWYTLAARQGHSGAKHCLWFENYLNDVIAEFF